jgi:hypothetical protein
MAGGEKMISSVDSGEGNSRVVWVGVAFARAGVGHERHCAA